MPAAPAPQPQAGGVGAQRRGEGGAGGRASRGRARRAPGGGGPGPGAAGLRPERGRTPTRRDAREGRGECCLGGSRGEAAAGAARRARPPPAPEVCKGTDSRPGSPRLPHSALGREECRPVDAAPPAASQAGRGRGRRGWRAVPPPGAPQRPPDALGPPKGPRCPDPSLSAETPSSRAAAPSHLLEFAAGLARQGAPPPLGGDRPAPPPPRPSSTSLAKKALEPPWPGLARPLRVGSTGSELCSSGPARGPGGWAPSVRLRPETGSPRAPRSGVEAPGWECVIREQAPQAAGRGAAHICASTPRGRGGREGLLAEALWAQPVTQEDGQGSLAVACSRLLGRWGLVPAAGGRLGYLPTLGRRGGSSYLGLGWL
eukprot:XP_022260823.1 uncharacterized protein LOC111090846 [Canis lupus familiaris]